MQLNDNAISTTSSSSSSHSQSDSRNKKENQFQIDLSKYRSYTEEIRNKNLNSRKFFFFCNTLTAGQRSVPPPASPGCSSHPRPPLRRSGCGRRHGGPD